jgi:triosephosphate isomerase
MHSYIRALIKEKFSSSIADQISIIYGGSCKPDNAKELFSMEDVDGGLIGGASLDADSFSAIINSF